jgi:hypothetical protein
MTENLFENGQLNRAAAAHSLQKFLEETIRTAKLDLQVRVTMLGEGSALDAGGAEVLPI